VHIDTGDLELGQPTSFGGLTVFPLHAATPPTADYVLAEEALRNGTLHVSEVSSHGRVSELRARNEGAERVLLLESMRLDGGKQNRVLNASVLVPAGATIDLPVTCIEQGRWSREHAPFEASDESVPHRLRLLLAETVTRACRRGRGFEADQAAVWTEIRSTLERHGIESKRLALGDLVERLRPRLEAYRRALPYVCGARGLAVGLGGEIAGLEVFDRRDTCARVWGPRLSGWALDAILQPANRLGSLDPRSTPRPPRDTARRVFRRALRARWEPAQGPGAGRHHRGGFGPEDHPASMLSLDGIVVHASFFLARRRVLR